MKKIYLFLIYIISIGFTNYSFADYPIVGYRYLADPGAFVYNGRVYVYCSNDDENVNDNGYQMSSIVCVSSSDLKNWTDHGVVFDVPRDARWSNLSWAPSPAYKNGKFYLYFGNGGSAIGVAVADSPLGPFVDPVGRAIANGSTPGVQPFDGWLFDPMTFIDDDGQAYMYFGGNGDGNLRVVKLNNDMISLNGSAGRFNVPNFFEAAWVHKHNGTYYFTYSTTPSAGMRIDYMTSNNPMSGFTYRGILSLQPPTNNNNNHQAIFQLNNQWYQMYHNRIVASQAGQTMTYKRNLAIDAFSHRADGTIVQMVNTTNGVVQVGRLNPYVRTEAETMSNHNGIETEVCSAGGMNLAFLDNNDWTMVEGVDFGSSGASSIAMRVASTKTGGTIEIRTGSSTGTLIGTVTVPNTGGNQTWQTVTANVTRTTGVQNVYFVFKGSGSSLFNVDYWTFATSGPQVSITAPLSNASIVVGDPITISATATMVGTGTISNVRFYDGTTLLNTVNTSPYSFVWTGATQGNHTIRAIATDNSGNTSESSVIITVRVPQGPFNGIFHPIPGTVQFENFDVGGNGFAYMDVTPGSAVTPVVNFRTDEDVDIENCTDVGGGYNLGYATAGEWTEYSADVQTPGEYSIALRVACSGAARTLSLAMDGVDIAKDVAIPNTTGWQVWQTVTVPKVNLKAGKQILRMTIGATDYINLNYITFTLTKELKQEPFTGIAFPIPGRIEAEHYDQGGEGLAYHEANTNGNEGGATLRNDEVDIEPTTDAGGGYNIGYALQGEWLEYTVDVASTGIYNLDLRMAADGAGKTLHIEIDGVDMTGPIQVPNTGGWQIWQTVSVEGLELIAGQHIMRVVFDADYMNLNWMEFRDVVTSIGTREWKGLSVFPIPFKDVLQVQYQGRFTYQILTTTGSLIEEGKGEDLLVVGSRIQHGLYLLKVYNPEEEVIMKIVKE